MAVVREAQPRRREALIVPVVDRLELGPLGTNCYIVRASAGAPEAVVVDPSGDAPRILRRLESFGARCAAILVTHGHWDHVLAVADLAEATAAPVHMADDERMLLERPGAFVPAGLTVRPWTPERTLVGDEVLDLAGMAFEVVSVPGHSPAHLAYHCAGELLSGDVLFAGSVGRADIPGADWSTLLDSIERLVDRFPPATVVHPGHGPETTLGDELEFNPFLGVLRAERAGEGH